MCRGPLVYYFGRIDEYIFRIFYTNIGYVYRFKCTYEGVALLTILKKSLKVTPLDKKIRDLLIFLGRFKLKNKLM